MEYREVAVEAIAAAEPAGFDLVTCLEMLEHVPDPAAIVACLGRLVRPGGHVVCSTINRNAKAFALAIVGAEYLMRLLPRARTSTQGSSGRRSFRAGPATPASNSPASPGSITIPSVARRVSSADVSVNYIAHYRRPMTPASA